MHCCLIATSSKWLSCENSGQNLDSKDWDRNAIASESLGLAHESTGSQVLSIASNILPFLMCSYNLKSVKLACFLVIWLYWRQTPQQQHRHIQEKMKTEIKIPQISTIIFPTIATPSKPLVC